MATGAEPKPWEQMSSESGPAYATFLAYRDLGPKRTYVAAARLVGRHESLLRRWATRHRWRERAWAYDLDQARQEETVVRQQRETVLRERLEDIDRLGRACLIFFRTLIHRDPETGEISFDGRFTPQLALRFLELALRAQGAFDRPAADDQRDARPAGDLFGLADGELEALIEAARERADQHQREENDNESHQGSTEDEQDQEEAELD